MQELNSQRRLRWKCKAGGWSLLTEAPGTSSFITQEWGLWEDRSIRRRYIFKSATLFFCRRLSHSPMLPGDHTRYPPTGESCCHVVFQDRNSQRLRDANTYHSSITSVSSIAPSYVHHQQEILHENLIFSPVLLLEAFILRTTRLRF